MPAYGIASNYAKFRPFSFAEYIAPYERYGQAYKEVEEGMAALEDKAAVLEKLRDSAIDKDSYKEYQDYINQVTAARDALYSQGLTGSDRNKLMQARRNYMSTIQPLQEAFERREKEALLQYQAEMSNPYVRFSRDARNTSLAQYKAGIPDIQVIDGTKLAAMASQMAQPYAQAILNDINTGRKDMTKILPYQYQQQVQYGLSPAQLLAGMAEMAAGDPKSEAAQIISNIQKQVYAQSGLGSWSEEKRKELDPWAYSMINSGLNSLIGKTVINNLEDKYSEQISLNADKLRNDIALETYKAGLAGGTSGGVGAGIDSDYIYNTIGVEQAKKDYEKYKSYFAVDSKGKVYMTQAGTDKYRKELAEYERDKKGNINWTDEFGVRDTNTVNMGASKSDFVRFVDATGAGSHIDLKGKTVNGKQRYASDRYAVGSKYKAYMEERGIGLNGNDVRGTAIIKRVFDENTSKSILKRIAGDMSTTITPVQYNGKSYIVPKGTKDFSKQSLRNNNVALQDVYVNEATGDLIARVYRVNDKSDGTGGKAAQDNETYSIKIPTSSSYYKGLKQYISQLQASNKAYEAAVKRGAGEQELALLDKAIQYNRNQLYREMGSIGSLGESVDEKYDPNK